MPVQRLFPEEQLDRYIRKGSKQVNGWLSSLDQQIILAIAKSQTERQIEGGIGEIGVYHGRLFIILYLLLHAGDKAFCVDVFGEFEQSEAHDVRGDEQLFLDNLRKYAGSPDRLNVIRKRSEDVAADEIMNAVGPVRLFSIDGGHSAETTENDLNIANSCLSEDGVIALDDFHNRNFPGVAHGFHNFFALKPDLAPFAIGSAKLYLCRPKSAEVYRRAVATTTSAKIKRQTEFYSYPVDVYKKIREHLGKRLSKRMVQVFWRDVL